MRREDTQPIGRSVVPVDVELAQHGADYPCSVGVKYAVIPAEEFDPNLRQGAFYEAAARDGTCMIAIRCPDTCPAILFARFATRSASTSAVENAAIANNPPCGHEAGSAEVSFVPPVSGISEFTAPSTAGDDLWDSANSTISEHSARITA